MTHTNLPSVSVVIPTRDRRKMLRPTLKSVLEQLDVDLQVIVVDDGSTDGTEAMLLGLADPRLVLIRHPVAKGQGTARNAGIAAAEGQWIAFIDDDDLWAPNKLASQIAAAAAVGAGFVYCGAFTFDRGFEGVIRDRDPPPPNRIGELMRYGNPLPGGCSAQMIEGTLGKRLGGFDERLEYLSDWDMWIRATRETPAAAVAEPLVAYRIHGGNRVALHGKDHLQEFDCLVAKHGHEFDGVGFHFWVANGQRRGHRQADAFRTHLRAARRYRNLGHLATAVRMPLGDWAIGLRHADNRERLPTPGWMISLAEREELWP